jgi:hypothetical protein
VPRASRCGEIIDWVSGKERGSPRNELYGGGGLAEAYASGGLSRGRWHRLTGHIGARWCRKPQGGGGRTRGWREGDVDGGSPSQWERMTVELLQALRPTTSLRMAIRQKAMDDA